MRKIDPCLNVNVRAQQTNFGHGSIGNTKRKLQAKRFEKKINIIT